MAHGKLNRKKLLNLLALVLLILAAVLLCVALLFQDPTFLQHYDEILRKLSDFEYTVAAIPYKGILIGVILLIYLFKAVLPLPISAICVIAGIAFPTPYAVLINLVGFSLLSLIKYLWGKHLGGGLVHRFLVRNDDVRRVLDYGDSKAKGALLIAFRIVPSFPVNTISQVYGAMRYDIRQYLLCSTLGFLPKLISYSIIGRHVFNPFSMAFLLPIILLLTFSGLSVFVVNHLITFYNANFKK